MIKDVKDFDGALKGFYDIVEKVKKAKTKEEISLLERQGRSAMREVQISAGYIGYRLKDAVDASRKRIEAELWKEVSTPAPAPAPVEKPVENSEKPKKTVKKKATKKEK